MTPRTFFLMCHRKERRERERGRMRNKIGDEKSLICGSIFYRSRFAPIFKDGRNVIFDFTDEFMVEGEFNLEQEMKEKKRLSQKVKEAKEKRKAKRAICHWRG